MQPVKAEKSRPSPFQGKSQVAVIPVKDPVPITGVRRVREFAAAKPRTGQLSTFEAEMLMEWSLP